jgi:predicted NBD/HSP70 family sugar kinase
VSDQDVLDLIRLSGPLTRALIARHCNLSKPTASVIAEGLLAAGLIREDGEAPRDRRGRPGRLLAFDPRAGYVIGMDVGGTSTRAQLADLDGTPLAEFQEPTRATDPDELIRQIATLRDRLLAEHAQAKDRLKAVAIGTPGVIDPATHRTHYAPNVPALGHPDFYARLSRAWPVPITMGNDVNFAALGEARIDRSRRIPDFVFVSIGTGLGFGIVQDGRIYHGHAGRAGELGYLPYPPGSDSTIESFVSGPGIGRRHERLGGSGLVQDAFDEADQGESPGKAAVEHFLSDLAWLLAIVSTLLDPHRIVLGGGIGVRCRPYIPHLESALWRLSPIRPVLAISQLGGRAGLVGAVSQALDDCRPIQRLKGGGAMYQS